MTPRNPRIAQLRAIAALDQMLELMNPPGANDRALAYLFWQHEDEIRELLNLALTKLGEDAKQSLEKATEGSLLSEV
jgi:16S rRNA G527 N7-methylase RsmG